MSNKPASKKAALKKAADPVFDPQKSYQWQREDTFEISGAELHALNQLSAILMEDPAVQRILAIVDGRNILTSIIRRNVEAGAIQEAVQVPE